MNVSKAMGPAKQALLINDITIVYFLFYIPSQIKEERADSLHEAS